MPALQKQCLAYVRRWFRQLGWRPLKFQEEAWQAYLRGEQGLIHSPTGTGKTLAAFMGPVIEWLENDPLLFHQLNRRQKENQMSAEESTECEPKPGDQPNSPTSPPGSVPPSIRRTAIDRLNRTKIPRRKLPRPNTDSHLQILWVTPLRALATDTEKSLAHVIDQTGLPWRIEKRTGDTDAVIRQRQRNNLPQVLITTPESLTLMISREEMLLRFGELKLVVVDEWHDLMGSKRGVQTELALARLRQLQPGLRVWGLSATIGNLDESLQRLTCLQHTAGGRLIRGNLEKQTRFRSIIPSDIERFPWAGHLGLRLASEVARLVASTGSSLLFTNTRSQTELWYRALLDCDSNLAGKIAVHHGSLDSGVRRWVEDALREGKLKCCVCTASLDLGVDYTAVDHVIQVGSPRGNARLLQRAGRSGHQPGVPSQLTFVPTHAIELVELAAARDSVAEGKIESRIPLSRPLDVLAQHVVTVALGGGFEPDRLLAEIRSTVAYANLTDEEWQWVLDFAERGGSSLEAYPDFHRIRMVEGKYRVLDKKIARLHRLSIGTIVSDASIQVRYLKGGSIGTVEESFIGRMDAGDRFLLGGKLLELVRIHDNIAWVRRATGRTTTIPRWMGGRLPLSNELSHAIREKLNQAREGVFDSAEMQSVKPLLEIQQSWSAIPASSELLIERLQNRDGFHLFIYPFDGRSIHEGLAALFAFRISRLAPVSFAMAVNDYGLMLVSPSDPPLGPAIENGLFDWNHLADDIFSSLNESEMCKRQFREIARVAGLVFEGYPGQRKQSRQLQASSNLFFDVFREYDPQNMLLIQARREVMEQQLEEARMIAVLQRLSVSRVVLRDVARPTPLGFPLLVEQLRDRLSSEKLSDRIRRMQQSLEQAANGPGIKGRA